MKRATLEKTWSRDKGKKTSDRRLEKTHVLFWDKNMVIVYLLFLFKKPNGSTAVLLLAGKGRERGVSHRFA